MVFACVAYGKIAQDKDSAYQLLNSNLDGKPEKLIFARDNPCT